MNEELHRVSVLDARTGATVAYHILIVHNRDNGTYEVVTDTGRTVFVAPTEKQARTYWNTLAEVLLLKSVALFDVQAERML